MSERSPDPWRTIWRYVTGDSLLVILLVAIAASVTLTAWIPQRPSSDADHARWFSQARARFGDLTPALRAAGLFDVTESLGFRVLLGLLSGCLLVRLTEEADRLRQGGGAVEPKGDWREIAGGSLEGMLDTLRGRRYRTLDGGSFYQVDRWPWAGMSVLMAHGGAVVLLVGLLLAHVGGWHVEGLILQEGQTASLPGANHWVALTEDGQGTRHSTGVVAFVERRGPGVSVRAVDDQGQPLGLQLTAEAEPSLELLIALTEDRYFAVPEAELIAHLMPQSDAPYALLDVQIYRSPPGEIIAEAVTDEGGQMELATERARLELTPAPYSEVTVSRNPGRWVAGCGVVLLMAGLVGNLMRPERRFWLRQGTGAMEAAGPVPASLLAVDEEEEM